MSWYVWNCSLRESQLVRYSVTNLQIFPCTEWIKNHRIKKEAMAPYLWINLDWFLKYYWVEDPFCCIGKVMNEWYVKTVFHTRPSVLHPRFQMHQDLNLALHLCLFDPLRTKTKTTHFPRELSSLYKIKVVVCSTKVTIIYKQKN